jgi:hypothetical protein
MDQDQSALEGLRLLHTSIEARLKKNDDYRVKLVLDRALAELTQSHLPLLQQLQAQAAAGMVVQQRPAQAPASDSSGSSNADPVVPAKNGLASKMAAARR